MMARSDVPCKHLIACPCHVGVFTERDHCLSGCPTLLPATKALVGCVQGQTDLNPTSAIGKLSQVVFAIISPGRVVANIVAGAIAEAGAQQAGDMMQVTPVNRLASRAAYRFASAQLDGGTQG